MSCATTRYPKGMPRFNQSGQCFRTVFMGLDHDNQERLIRYYEKRDLMNMKRIEELKKQRIA